MLWLLLKTHTVVKPLSSTTDVLACKSGGSAVRGTKGEIYTSPRMHRRHRTHSQLRHVPSHVMSFFTSILMSNKKAQKRDYFSC